MKTYTPGFFWTKVVSLILSLVVLVLGLSDIVYNAQFILSSGARDVEIVRVEKTRPGAATEVYSTTEPIKEDKNRSARFWHYVDFVTDDGKAVTAKLNICTIKNPAYKVGDRVSIAYKKERPEIAIAVYDLRTWSLGFFVFLVGFCFAVTSFFLALYARKPIIVPDDTPEGDPDIKVVPDAPAA